MEEGKTVLHLECKMMEIKPVACVKNDLPFLMDEKFDFDLSLSPSSENEDEVFIGAVGHKEKCIAVALRACDGTENATPPPPAAHGPEWSPLAGQKFVEIFKEAHKVAVQLQSASKTKREQAEQVADRKAVSVETFVQESKSKLKLFERRLETNGTPRAVKRETYCVWDSPACQLPPSFQRNSGPPVASMDNLLSPQTPLNASSPVKTESLPPVFITPLVQDCSNKCSLKREPVKSLAAFGNGKHLAAEQLKSGRLPSSSSRKFSNSIGSSEDLLSDKSSNASDVGDASFCNVSLVQDRKTLPVLNKLGLKTSQLKPPGNVHLRKNASSSSSSSRSSMNSSLNSSLSISPQRGQVKASVTAKASAHTSRLSCGTIKMAVVRPRPLSSVHLSQSDASGRQKWPSGGAKGNPPPVNTPKYKATTQLAEASSNGIQQKRLDSGLQNSPKITSGNKKANSCLRSKTVATHSTNEENTAAKVLQPVGLLSRGNIGSNIAVSPLGKLSKDGIRSNSCSFAKPALLTPVNVKHFALPTPLGRRVSGIPTTPKTVPRSMSSSSILPVRQVSSVSSKKNLGAGQAKESKTWRLMPSSPPSPEDSCPLHVVPLALDFSPEKTSAEPELGLTETQTAVQEMQVKEGLLVDIGIDKTPVGSQECENRPLIDLFNTPEIIKPILSKPSVQLIDLSSPLIRLSPEGNKENLDSPLLKF